jgi:hypothetical protein
MVKNTTESHRPFLKRIRIDPARPTRWRPPPCPPVLHRKLAPTSLVGISFPKRNGRSAFSHLNFSSDDSVIDFPEVFSGPPSEPSSSKALKRALGPPWRTSPKRALFPVCGRYNYLLPQGESSAQESAYFRDQAPPSPNASKSAKRPSSLPLARGIAAPVSRSLVHPSPRPVAQELDATHGSSYSVPIPNATRALPSSHVVWDRTIPPVPLTGSFVTPPKLPRNPSTHAKATLAPDVPTLQKARPDLSFQPFAQQPLQDDRGYGFVSDFADFLV